MDSQFKKSDRKLRELNRHFDLMVHSKSVDEFEDHFSAFIAAGRTVTLAIQSEFNKIPSFSEWYCIKQKEMKNDELCKFFKEVRDSDLHTGKTIINSSVHIQGPIDSREWKDRPNNSILQITGRDVYYVINAGTADEKIIPAKIPNPIIVNYWFSNPPRKHLGKLILDTSPINLCKLFKEYLESILYQAKKQFLVKGSKLK